MHNRFNDDYSYTENDYGGFDGHEHGHDAGEHEHFDHEDDFFSEQSRPQYCDGCGRRCPLTNPRCGLGFQIAAEIEEGRYSEHQQGERDHNGRQHDDHDYSERQYSDHENERWHGRRGSRDWHDGSRGGRGRSFGGRGRGYGRGNGPDSRSFGNPEVDERLSKVLHHCARVLVHRERHQGGRASALAVLGSHGEMSQARLAEKLDIRGASASELLAKMDSDGLVVREPDERDGRAYNLRLTEKGMQESHEIQQQRKERDKDLFEALSDDEKVQLIDLLDKLASSWRH